MLLFSAYLTAQRKRAFLVGISKYDTPMTGYQWHNINGAEDVKLLEPILKEQKFSLVTLLNEQATYNNITKRLCAFIHATKKGDIVYLHFSGHGQPVEDLNGDEDDGWDESIVPTDAHKIFQKGVYEGKRHIIDDQINKYIMHLRLKIGSKGFLYVVIDACHAGTASRGDNDLIRGTNQGFAYHSNRVYRPKADVRTHYNVGKSPKLANILFLEACRCDQVNTEIKEDGHYYGALSYNVAQAITVCGINDQPVVLLNSILKSILQPGRWPNNQNIVTETSY